MSHPPQRPTFWQVIPGTVSTVGFALGFALGFLVLILLGHWIVGQDVMRGHVRFTQTRHREGLVYPTARHLMRLVDTRVQPGEIAVIIGGSSIAQGVGQHIDALWSNRLQAQLGPRYRVVNLATKAGDPNELGMWACEHLIAEGRQAIYVTDYSLHNILDPFGTFDQYLYFDFRSAGGLLPCPAREAANWNLPRTQREKRIEMAIQSKVNEITRANDLWCGLAYGHVFTVWNHISRERPIWTPRDDFPDGQTIIAKADPTAPRFMDTVKRRINLAGSITQASQIDWRVKEFIPDEIRKRMVAAVVVDNPQAVGRLPLDHQHLYGFLAECLVRHLESAGFQVVTMQGRVQPEDYVDLRHFSASGGAKMADLVEVAVRARAKELGYVQ